MDMWRQGDLLIVPDGISDMDSHRLVPSGIVELGEATGHAHKLIGGEVFQYAYGNEKYVRTDGTAELVHEEHDTIVLPEGTYRVLRQREFQGEGQWSDVWD